MEDNVNFYSLLIISALAFIIPLVVDKIKKVRIPVVIAEITAGLLVGKSGLNIVQNDLWIEFLSLLGFAFLMFLSGVEIDFSYFKKAKNSTQEKGNPLYWGLLIFVLTLILSYGFSRFLFENNLVTNPLFLTLIFSTTSLGIVVPILKEKQILAEPIGQTILLSALIADFGTMLLVPIVMFLAESKKSIDLLTSFIIFGFFALSYLTGKRLFKLDFKNNPTFETSQLKVRAAFAFVLVFVTIAEITNVEIILGAFLAGVLFSLLFDEFRTEIAPKLDAIGYGFLIPIFFIMVGANLNLRTILTVKTLIILPVFILIMYIVKILPGLILKIRFSLRESIGAGLLLSSRLSLIIAISLVAWNSDIINETTYSTFVLVAILSSIISPVMFLKIFSLNAKKKEHILIAGDNEVLISLIRKLSHSEEEPIILAETNEKIRERLKNLKIDYIYWGSLSLEHLEQYKNLSISVFIALYNNNSKSIDSCKIAVKLGIRNVIALIEDPKISYELERQGIKTVTPIKAMYTLLYGVIKFPESYEILYSPEEKNQIQVKEIKLISQKIIGSTLKETKLPGDCLILLVSRGGRRIVPDGDTQLETDDILVIVGSKEYLDILDDVLI